MGGANYKMDKEPKLHKQLDCKDDISNFKDFINRITNVRGELIHGELMTVNEMKETDQGTYKVDTKERFIFSQRLPVNRVKEFNSSLKNEYLINSPQSIENLAQAVNKIN